MSERPFRHTVARCVLTGAMILSGATAVAEAQTVSPPDTIAVGLHAREVAAQVPVATYFVGGAVTAPLFVGAMLSVGRGDLPSPLLAIGSAGFFTVAGMAGRGDVALSPEAEAALTSMNTIEAEVFARHYRDAVRSRRSKAAVTGSVVGVVAGLLFVMDALNGG